MTPAEQIAWHRSEADRIEAEERARRPALAAGQVWRHPEHGHSVVEDPGISSHGGFTMWSLFGDIPMCEGAVSLEPGWEYVGLARDVLRVVPPAPQVAPEPTGAELVGKRCWLKESKGSPWIGPAVVDEYDAKGEDGLWYRSMDRSVDGVWFFDAKPYVEGVAP